MPAREQRMLEVNSENALPPHATQMLDGRDKLCTIFKKGGKSVTHSGPLRLIQPTNFVKPSPSDAPDNAFLDLQASITPATPVVNARTPGHPQNGRPQRCNALAGVSNTDIRLTGQCEYLMVFSCLSCGLHSPDLGF